MPIWYAIGFWITLVATSLFMVYAFYRGYKTHCLNNVTPMHLFIPLFVAALWPFALPVLAIAMAPGFKDDNNDEEELEAPREATTHSDTYPVRFSQKEM